MPLKRRMSRPVFLQHRARRSTSLQSLHFPTSVLHSDVLLHNLIFIYRMFDVIQELLQLSLWRSRCWKAIQGRTYCACDSGIHANELGGMMPTSVTTAVILVGGVKSYNGLNCNRCDPSWSRSSPFRF